jgi:hypothetical protein
VQVTDQVGGRNRRHRKVQIRYYFRSIMANLSYLTLPYPRYVGMYHLRFPWFIFSRERAQKIKNLQIRHIYTRNVRWAQSVTSRYTVQVSITCQNQRLSKSRHPLPAVSSASIVGPTVVPVAAAMVPIMAVVPIAAIAWAWSVIVGGLVGRSSGGTDVGVSRGCHNTSAGSKVSYISSMRGGRMLYLRARRARRARFLKVNIVGFGLIESLIL